MSFAYLFNTCWMAGCYREARAFERASKEVRQTQARLLQRILKQNRDTLFGRKHGFESILDDRDFQNAVPISTYDDYRADVDRIAGGERNVLTAEQVQLLEPTGGSMSGEKLIPYTPGLRRSFLRGVRAWIWDLYSNRPAIRDGRSYWSITPLANAGRRTTAGIPIGFEGDTHYLSRGEKFLAERTVIVPPDVLAASSVAAAQYVTLFHLLRAPDLSLISAWSPTFLTGLFHFLADHWRQLARDIAEGQVAFDIDGPSKSSRQQYKPCVERSEELRHIFQNTSNVHQCVPQLWPALALVSCWADGPSLVHANSLRRYLGGIELQPKGLLATEAIVTVPLLACAAAALAIRSHFFEFLPASATAENGAVRPLLADELTEGNRYRVLVTTDGGLYRYQLHDEVEAVGARNQTPLLRFVGKTNEISDLVGEKLHAAHVQSVLQQAFQQLGVQPIYSQLCAQSPDVAGYVLQLAAPQVAYTPELQSLLREAVERGLENNLGYKYARLLGQLQPLKIELIDRAEADELTARHARERASNGQRLGDVKPTSLNRLPSRRGQ